MAESTLTRIRWTITRKAAVVQELLRGGDAIELASPPQKSLELVTFEWKKTHGLVQCFARGHEKP
jgi:hypothetical protein